MYCQQQPPMNMCYAANVVDAMSYCGRYGMDITTCNYSDFGGETHMGYTCIPPRDLPMMQPCYYPMPYYRRPYSYRSRSSSRSSRSSRSSSRSSRSSRSSSSSSNK